MIGTLLFIVLYGSWKTRKNKTIQGFLKGDNEMNALTIGLSVMATQASAITFLSTPGQAYESGMGFVQFYFGLPLALILVSSVFIPIYYKLSVFTAYEYLEKRFGVYARLLTAFLFLVSRGLAAGITIYAPSIVLSTLLGWNLQITNVVVGTLVIVYTVSGGTKAVSLTQKWQMAVIMGGMFLAFGIIIYQLSDYLSFVEAIDVAGIMGKMEIIDTSLNLENRYTLWSGLLGGLFLSLSYFGTDQSQVQRYLGGKNIRESRLGLMFNAILKIPMQFFILLVGALVFVFFQFNEPPAFFNQPGRDRAVHSEHKLEIEKLEHQYSQQFVEKRRELQIYLDSKNESERLAARDKARLLYDKSQNTREELKKTLKKANTEIETRDTDYVFLTFILRYLPHGIIGLLLAVILSAAMSSTAGELNALASTTMVDFYRRLGKKPQSDKEEVRTTRWITLIWGVLAIIVALSAHLFENLIQLVNILGSLFYGTILGIFLTAFFIRFVGQKAILIGAVIGEVSVLTLHLLTSLDIISVPYLWYNVVGCIITIGVAVFVQQLLLTSQPNPENEN
jgi:Na+/proline symporter